MQFAESPVDINNDNNIKSRKERKANNKRKKKKQYNDNKYNQKSFSIPFPKKKEDGTWKFENVNIDVNTPKTDNSDFNLDLSFDVGGNNITTSFKMNKDTFDFSVNTDDEINCTYNDDINIMEIHRKIMKILKDDPIDCLHKYKNILDEEIEKIKQPQNWKEKESRKIKILSLMKKIAEIENNHKYEKYIQESLPILNEYLKHRNQKIYIPFFSLEDNSSSDIILVKMKLINQYLNIASQYTKLNLTKEFTNLDNTSCECGYDLSNGAELHNNTEKVCPECQMQISNFENHIDFEGTLSDINKSSKMYEGKINFIKKLDCFVGIKPSLYPSNYEEILDKYFIRHSLPIGSSIRCLEYNSDGRTKGYVTKEMMFDALSYTKMSSLYEHIEWLCYIYWGWKRRNIDKYRAQILSDYDASQEIIYKHSGRRSNLNRDYRLYRHLEKLKYEHLDKCDFRLIKTKDSLDFHEKIWIDYVVKDLKWDQEPYNYKPEPFKNR